MSNEYFNLENPLTRHTLGRAEQVNSIFREVEAAFDKIVGPDAINQGRVTYAEDTGEANSYDVALPVAITAYTEGLILTMKAANANTGASVINVDELGVKSIKRYDGSDLQADDIRAGMLVHLGYDGTKFLLIGVHGGEVTLAKSWATSTSVVADSLKGARGYAQDASSSASAASASESAAATSESNVESHFNTFRGIFYGPAASDPALDPNGNSPSAGDWYLNTTTGATRIFDGEAWSDIVGGSRLDLFEFTATGGETEVSGADDNGRILAYSPGLVHVYRNGSRLADGDDYTADNGNSISDLDALSALDVILVDAFTPFDVANVLLRDENLDDLQSKSQARTNLGVPATPDTLLKAGNLSGLASASTARTNLGVYSKSETDSAIANRAGSIVQLVEAEDTSADTTTSMSFVNTSLSASITPQAVGNRIEVEVIIPNARAEHTGIFSKSMSTIHMFRVNGSSLGASPEFQSGLEVSLTISGDDQLKVDNVYADVNIKASYTASGTSEETFTLQHRVNAADKTSHTNGNLQPVKMIIREYWPIP